MPRLPTYEYHCDSCDQNFDVVQSFTDDPLTACPTCGSPVRKVFGSVGIVFKGSGFYKTDSRSGGSSATVPSESSAPAAASTDSGSGSSDSSTSTPAADKPAVSTPTPAPASKGTSPYPA